MVKSSKDVKGCKIECWVCKSKNVPITEELHYMESWHSPFIVHENAPPIRMILIFPKEIPLCKKHRGYYIKLLCQRLIDYYDKRKDK